MLPSISIDEILLQLIVKPHLQKVRMLFADGPCCGRMSNGLSGRSGSAPAFWDPCSAKLALKRRQVGTGTAFWEPKCRQVGPGPAFWESKWRQDGTGTAVWEPRWRQVGTGTAFWETRWRQVGSGPAFWAPRSQKKPLHSFHDPRPRPEIYR